MSRQPSRPRPDGLTPELLRRFQGEPGAASLVEALRRQRVVEGSEELAKALADVAELHFLLPGERLVHQDDCDADLFFVLSGRVAVLVNGREVALREAGCHVGEMTLIDPAARRSATVVASGEVVVAKVTEPDFTRIADQHPRVWRLLAVEMAQRLRQRNELVSTPNPRPVLFIGSSTESLRIAQTIQSGLEYDDLLARVWTDGVFLPSHYTMEDLETQVKTSDFALLVFSPDDRVFVRGRASLAPRDNVILELGLFMGTLGRERTMIVMPRGKDLRIPTDLIGLKPITYMPGDVEDLAALLGTACGEIRSVIRRHGCR